MNNQDKQALLVHSAESQPEPSRAVDLSIIIVHYKTLDLTLQCLESIYLHPPKRSFEVIILDNASGDSIEERLNENFPQARFLKTGSNVGFGCANNLGIHNSHGHYILLLNSDAKVVGTSLDAMTAYLAVHPGVGAVGPHHLDSHGRFQLSYGQFPTLTSELIRKLIHYRLTLNDYRLRDFLEGTLTHTRAVDWISGSCLMVKRQVLYQTGLLDERFFMYFEDIDICTRIRDQGWEIHFLAEHHLTHVGGASVRKNLLSIHVENRKSQLYFSGKYYGFWGEWIIRLILLVKYGFSLIKWVSIFGFRRLVKRKHRYAYTMALLSKKVIMTSLRRVPSRAIIPSLHENQDLHPRFQTHADTVYSTQN